MSPKMEKVERRRGPIVMEADRRHAVTAGLGLIFFLSGASALIDQIVWARALHRIFGVTSLATATVLAAFMAGLSLGSYTLGRWVDRCVSPLRLYGFLELLIAILAPATLFLFRAFEPLYVSVGQFLGLGSPFLPWARLLFSFVLLLPPTFLMGGTLPVLAKPLPAKAGRFPLRLKVA